MSIDSYRSERKNRKCGFCVYCNHITPPNMPSCIPDVYKCQVKDKIIQPSDRRPFCKYYKVNRKECDEIDDRAALLSKIDKENN